MWIKLTRIYHDYDVLCWVNMSRFITMEVVEKSGKTFTCLETEAGGTVNVTENIEEILSKLSFVISMPNLGRT
jgi:hypothetical protein